MEKKADPSLFVNDGSFMERFRQLQQEKEAKEATPNAPKSSVSAGGTPTVVKPTVITNKRAFEVKANDGKKPTPASSNGKLAFSLKQKSKVVAPAVKLGEDESGEPGSGSSGESAKRQKFGAPDVSHPSIRQGDAPPPPSDHAVRTVADRLASFVAKHGRQIEHITRQKNPGDTPFKFLFDTSCSDYQYYEHKLLEEEKALVEAKGPQATSAVTTSSTSSRASRLSQGNHSQNSNYQIPASALYSSGEEAAPYASLAGSSTYGESVAPASDPLAMMEFYMKRAAQEERKRPPKHSKDEMPPPTCLQASNKKGHHMGDYIPPEELEKFLATCNDAAYQKAAREAAERAKIQADNIGHKLLSKMGWREGEGLGADKSGRADPVMAGDVKKDNLGVGASRPGEVTPEDDIYEQYKKRMMLGYKYRPNPLGNPRKAYY